MSWDEESGDISSQTDFEEKRVLYVSDSYDEEQDYEETDSSELEWFNHFHTLRRTRFEREREEGEEDLDEESVGDWWGAMR
jgi:hypothetical protein